MKEDYKGLLSNNNYYNGDLQSENKIIKLDDLEKCNLEKYSLSLLYEKIKLLLNI